MIREAIEFAFELTAIALFTVTIVGATVFIFAMVHG